MTPPEVEHRFTYHPPNQAQVPKFKQIRQGARQMATDICDLCPVSREQSLAITKLDECVMWANAAIARHP